MMGCWKETPRDPLISACQYERNATDPKCFGCADSPWTQREKEMDEIQRRIQLSWSRRWEHAIRAMHD